MKIKKIFTTLAISMIALATSFSSAFASSGWDYLGKYNLVLQNGWYVSPMLVYSTGGNFQVCVTPPSNVRGGISVTLMESDPGSDNDDFVGYKTLGQAGGCVTFYSIGKFVDGTNKKAEFYIETTTSGKVTFYD